MGFNTEGGTINFNFLPKRHIRTYATNYATNIDEMDAESVCTPSVISSYGGVPLHNKSHGESYMALVENRFAGNGLYILDEQEKMIENLLG